MKHTGGVGARRPVGNTGDVEARRLEKTLHAGDPQRSPEPQPEAHLRYYVVSSHYSKFQVGKLTERVREEIPQSKATLIVLAGI